MVKGHGDGLGPPKHAIRGFRSGDAVQMRMTNIRGDVDWVPATVSFFPSLIYGHVSLHFYEYPLHEVPYFSSAVSQHVCNQVFDLVLYSPN